MIKPISIEKNYDSLKKNKIVQFRRYIPQDQLQALELWKAAFGKSLDPKIWQWKYHGTFESKCIVAEHASGQLIAMFGGVLYPAMARNRKVEIIHLWDNMSHPGYRAILGGRRGLFVKTVDVFIKTFCGDQKAVFLYGFPGERHFRLGQHTLNYGMLTEGAVCLEGVVDDLIVSVKRGSIEKLSSADSRFNSLAKEFDGFLPFWVRRDSRFIQWRYFEHPENTYRIYGYRRGWRNLLSGLMVLSDEADQDTGVVVDFLLPADETKALSFLGQMILEWRYLGWKRVRTWIPRGSALLKVWQKVGFYDIPEPIGFIPTGRTFSAQLDWPWASRNLFYTMGDGDLF